MKSFTFHSILFLSFSKNFFFMFIYSLNSIIENLEKYK